MGAVSTRATRTERIVGMRTFVAAVITAAVRWITSEAIDRSNLPLSAPAKRHCGHGTPRGNGTEAMRVVVDRPAHSIQTSLRFGLILPDMLIISSCRQNLQASAHINKDQNPTCRRLSSKVLATLRQDIMPPVPRSSYSLQTRQSCFGAPNTACQTSGQCICSDTSRLLQCCTNGIWGQVMALGPNEVCKRNPEIPGAGTGGDHGLSKGQIAAIVIGAIFGAIVLLGFAYLCLGCYYTWSDDRDRGNSRWPTYIEDIEHGSPQRRPRRPRGDEGGSPGRDRRGARGGHHEPDRRDSHRNGRGRQDEPRGRSRRRSQQHESDY